MELPSTEALLCCFFLQYWPDHITDALMVSSQTTHLNSESSVASFILLQSSVSCLFIWKVTGK